jgi:hypothetical protein
MFLLGILENTSPPLFFIAWIFLQWIASRLAVKGKMFFNSKQLKKMKGFPFTYEGNYRPWRKRDWAEWGNTDGSPLEREEILIEFTPKAGDGWVPSWHDD